MLVRLVLAVDDLVTPGVDVNTLAIITRELILGTPRQLNSDVVGLPIITGYNSSVIWDQMVCFY